MSNPQSIVGGELVPETEASLASVIKFRHHGGFCSSVLIEGDFFLTAAHCSIYQRERIEVSFYKLDRWGLGDFSNSLNVHPNYSDALSGFDLAISKGPTGLSIPREEIFSLVRSVNLL